MKIVNDTCYSDSRSPEKEQTSAWDYVSFFWPALFFFKTRSLKMLYLAEKASFCYENLRVFTAKYEKLTVMFAGENDTYDPNIWQGPQFYIRTIC